MNKTPRLDTDRRKQFALRWEVVDNLKKARLHPAKPHLALTLKDAAKELRVDPRYLQMAENGIRVPRYRKALKMMGWIWKRLGFTPKETR